jgi:hypothetical protein
MVFLTNLLLIFIIFHTFKHGVTVGREIGKKAKYAVWFLALSLIFLQGYHFFR